MKGVLIVFVILGVAVQNNAISYNTQFDQCIRELSLNSMEIYNAHKADYLIKSRNYNYIKFMDCFWKRIGFMSPNGDVNYEELKMMYVELMTPVYGQNKGWTRANEVVNRCRGIRRQNDGLTAIETGHCLITVSTSKNLV